MLVDFLILVILFLFKLHVLIGFIADLCTILGLTGLVLTYKDYKNRSKENEKNQLYESLQAIRIIKHQLITMRDWVSFFGNGYKNEDKTKWKVGAYQERSNPLNFTIEINSEPISQINLLPGTKYLNEAVIETAAKLNQYLTSYQTLLLEMRLFRHSRGADKNVELGNKILANEKLSTEEQVFCDRLYNYQEHLHFNIISDKDHKCLHYWHSELTKLIDEAESKILKDLKKF